MAGKAALHFGDSERHNILDTSSACKFKETRAFSLTGVMYLSLSSVDLVKHHAFSAYRGEG